MLRVFPSLETSLPGKSIRVARMRPAHLYQSHSFCSVTAFRVNHFKILSFYQQSLLLTLKKKLSITLTSRQNMGNIFSSLSPVPATHPTPRGMEEIQHQESETFQVECAVCLTDRLVFKKMHHSWSPETGHYVCFGCFRAWKRACK